MIMGEALPSYQVSDTRREKATNLPGMGGNFHAENSGGKTLLLLFQPPKHSVRALKKYLLCLVSSMGLIDCMQ